MVRNIINDLCHHLEIGIDGNLDIGNKRVIVGTPTITLIGNTFTISCSTSNVNIYYTLDGSTPTSNSIRYTSAVTLNNSCTIKAIAIKGNKYSAIAEETYIKPIIYLTQWKIVGNSEVHTLPYPDGVVLPNGYKRCEYLTFDGSSYINTGIKTANDIGYNFACSTNGNQPMCLIGSRLSQNTQGFVLGFGNVAYGGVSVVEGITYNQTKTTVILDSTQCKVGGINYDITDIRGTADSFFDIYIGSWNSNNDADTRMWKGNIYDTIIYNTQGELWHGIPCLDANDVPCFYDIVSHTAFYNQGSGSFTYELYLQPTEIWSCGEYNATDGKYHILVQPQGGSIADIALTEPLRKVNDIADTIEFPAVLEAFTDADGNQVATTLPNNTILHIQNLYDYTQITRQNIVVNNISQRNAEIKISSLVAANYCGFNIQLQSGNYYSSCFFKNEDAKPNVIYSNSDNSSTVSSSDYQKISLLKSNVSTFRYSALNKPSGVWEINDVFFVKDINIFDIDAMFADCMGLKPVRALDFEALFPNLGCIDRTNTAIDVIVKDGKLYKYVETEGKALVTRNLAIAWWKDMSIIYQLINNQQVSNYERFYTTSLNKTIGNTTGLNTSICLSANYEQHHTPVSLVYGKDRCMCVYDKAVYIRDIDCHSKVDFEAKNANNYFFYVLATPTTELVDAPQIEEAESYTCEISQGAKAVSWSSFETE